MEDGNHFIIHIDHFKVLLFLINIVCNIFVWLTFGGGGVGGGCCMYNCCCDKSSNRGMTKEEYEKVLQCDRMTEFKE